MLFSEKVCEIQFVEYGIAFFSDKTRMSYIVVYRNSSAVLTFTITKLSSNFIKAKCAGPINGCASHRSNGNSSDASNDTSCMQSLMLLAIQAY